MRTVGAPKEVDVDVDIAAVVLSRSVDDQAHFRVEAGKSADQFLRFYAEERGGCLFVRGRDNGALKQLGFFQFNVSIHISVPASCSVRASTGNGSVYVQGLDGETFVYTSSGSIRFSGLSGSACAETNSGRIDARSCSGHLELETASGRLDVVDFSGRLCARSSGGAVKLDRVGGIVDVRTADGSLKARGVEGHGRLSSSGGHVSVDLVKSTGDWNVAAVEGAVNIKLPSGTPYTVEARSLHGRIENRLRMGEVVEQTVSYQRVLVFGGGDRLRLEGAQGVRFE